MVFNTLVDLNKLDEEFPSFLFTHMCVYIYLYDIFEFLKLAFNSRAVARFEKELHRGQRFLRQISKNMLMNSAMITLSLLFIEISKM